VSEKELDTNYKKDPESDLIRVLSHQLKSPINSIESLLKVIVDGFTGNIDDKSLHFIKKAIDRAGEARKIVTDIINFEKYPGNRLEDRSDVDLNVFLTLLTRKHQEAAAKKNIALTCSIPEKNSIVISGNPAALGVALDNLVENAVKYSPGHKRISINLGYDESDNKAVIKIDDQGYGIPEDEIKKVFEAFYRSTVHRTKISGTGLGLSIVKRIIEGHNGKISIDSKKDEGTSCTLKLPVLELKKSRKSSDQRKKVVIIGGITAGPKAAARLRRLDENMDIYIIERSEFLSYAGCGLPAYISGKLKSPKALMSTSDNTIRDVHFFETIKNIKVFNKTEAVEIDRRNKKVITKNLATGELSPIYYDILILATGAGSVVPDIDGINQEGIFSLHKFEDARNIRKKFLKKNARDLFIIGGGLIGTETAESLMHVGARVTILEQKSCILNLFDEEISEKIRMELNSKGIKVLTNVSINKIEKTEKSLIIHTDKNIFYADIILLSAGVKPNSILGENCGLELGKNKGIKVNEYLQTSDKNIYAIGDCAESIHLLTGKHTYWPLGSVSTKMGRIVADNIQGRKKKFHGHTGTAMFKIFNTQIARTGLNVAEAEEAGYNVDTIIVSGLDRSHYTEHAGYIVIKLIAEKKSHILLGAQGYGQGDVIKRIEILVCAISQKMTLDEVFQLDLGYYPAFNNPIDILQTACLVLKNKIEKICNIISLSDFNNNKDEYKVIDVSPVLEHEYNSIPGSTNISLEHLRAESLLPEKNAKIVLYSKTSSRAYEAYRYLITLGYKKLYVLEGGYIFWK